MEPQVLHFLYFASILTSATLIVKYVSTAQAARYKMEQEKYKYERRQEYYDNYR